ncbi:hypothetical protein BESB_057070 [Besnoitia besnoiti]|uniref:Uncharacterized protein n=1 Tax=Besnoitia besnoiti TaxID=94643 RepID=A0A2A9MJA9_BESBE|nr:hypothetical protein BESB_057070 [Besnoitia besnoiti]PFH36056.1 hypothetical protein BESB_057070 [Besnoitia besnoiti]
MSPKKAGKQGRGSAPSSQQRGRRGGKAAFSRKKGQRRTKVQSRRANVTAASFMERARQELARYNVPPKKMKKSAAKAGNGAQPGKRGVKNALPTGGRPTHLLPVRPSGQDEVGVKELWASLRAFDEENRQVERERVEKRRRREARQQIASGCGPAEEKSRAMERAAADGKAAAAIEERDLATMTRSERRKMRLRRQKMASEQRERAERPPANPEDGDAKKAGKGKALAREEVERQREAVEEDSEPNDSLEGGDDELALRVNGGKGEQDRKRKRVCREVHDEDEPDSVRVRVKKSVVPRVNSETVKSASEGEKKVRPGKCPVMRRKGESFASFSKRVDAWTRESLRTSSSSAPAGEKVKGKVKEDVAAEAERGSQSRTSAREELAESLTPAAPAASRPAFGEVVDRPPELRRFNDAFARFKAKTDASRPRVSAAADNGAKWTKKGMSADATSAGGRGDADEEDSTRGGEAPEAYVQQVRAAYVALKQAKRHAKFEGKKGTAGKRESEGTQETSYTRPGWVSSAASLHDSQWIGVGRYRPLEQ